MKERALNVTFQLGAGSFTEAPGKNAVVLSGLRISAQISNSGTIGAAAQLRVWGMRDSQMAQLSTLGLRIPYLQAKQNYVTIAAGDKGASSLPTVFRGVIYSAYQDFDAMPEVFFNVMSNTTYYDQLAAVQPTSFAGDADVATIMQNLANQMGRPFHNWGVTATLANPYFSGSAYDQARKVQQAANINMNFDPATGALEIWPRDGTRNPSSQIPVISPDTGLIGYPSYTENGIVVRSVYNPNVIFGSKIKVVSDLPRASGIRVVREITYNLESELPGGQWTMTMQCYDPGAVVIPRPGAY